MSRFKTALYSAAVVAWLTAGLSFSLPATAATTGEGTVPMTQPSSADKPVQLAANYCSWYAIFQCARQSYGLRGPGYVIQSGGAYDLDATGWRSSPCAVKGPPPPAGALGTIHPHVQPAGTDISLFCRSFFEDAYAAGHEQSYDDTRSAIRQFAKAPNQFILTGSRIIVYRWNTNPGPGLAPRMDMVVLRRCGY